MVVVHARSVLTTHAMMQSIHRDTFMCTQKTLKKQRFLGALPGWVPDGSGQGGLFSPKITKF